MDFGGQKVWMKARKPSLRDHGGRHGAMGLDRRYRRTQDEGLRL